MTMNGDFESLKAVHEWTVVLIVYIKEDKIS